MVLRPSDQIIVGTGFWNRPMFILREGFRTNYGFSLRLDRNFGNDVFGVPPFAGLGAKRHCRVLNGLDSPETMADGSAYRT